MSGALINLAANGMIESNLKINKKSLDFSKHTIINDKVNISRQGDLYNLRTIQFVNPSENFKFKSFSIIIGGSVISKIYIDICKYISKENNNSQFIEIFEVNEKKIINFNIPWSELGYTDIIKLVALQYHYVEFTIDYDGQFEKCDLYGNYKYICSDERRCMAQYPHTNNIIQMVKQNISHLTDSSEHKLLFTGLGNDLFFENFDFNNINNVKLLLNGHEFISLDQFNYKSFLKQISKNTFYFSLDNTNKIINNDKSYGINFSRIDNVKLVINSTKQFNGKISSILINQFRIMSGMGGTLFSNDLEINKIIIQKIKKCITGDNFCGIHFTNIEENDEYLSCSVCNKNFHTEITYDWIKEKNKCPHCCQKWKDFTIYINSN